MRQKGDKKMLYADGTCEVCGGKEHIAGVACSPLGPCSFCYCHICLLMNADPKWWIESIVEECDGIKNVNPGLPLTYFENDSYYDFRTRKIIPIKTHFDGDFTKKSDIIKLINKKETLLKNKE
jgi:hypothetical protein